MGAYFEETHELLENSPLSFKETLPVRSKGS